MNSINKKLKRFAIEELEESTNFKKRKSKKITGRAYLSSFISSVIQGNISQANWSRQLSFQTGQLISSQALQNKVQIRHQAFAAAFLAQVLKEQAFHFEKANKLKSFLEIYDGVKVHDSTCIKLPQGVMDQYPGSRSQNGATAMARIQLSLEILEGEYETIQISSFRKNDQKYVPDLIKQIGENELHLFDLGYLQLPLLQAIKKENSFFICRHQHQWHLFREGHQQKMNLAKYLKSLERKGIYCWDENVQVGKKDRLQLRLVAVKVPEQVAEKRRRKKLNNRDKRVQYTKDYLYLLGWNIFFTNIDVSTFSSHRIMYIYGFRWRIECVFKAWKSKLQLAKLFAKQHYTLGSRAFIQLHLVLATITLLMSDYQNLMCQVFKTTARHLSLFKFMDFIIQQFQGNREFKNENLVKFLAYHYSYDKRKDRLSFIEYLYMF